MIDIRLIYTRMVAFIGGVIGIKLKIPVGHSWAQWQQLQFLILAVIWAISYQVLTLVRRVLSAAA